MKRRYYTKVTRKGQVTVPVEVRRQLSISEGDLVSFLVEDGKVAFEPKGSWVAATAGILKREGAPVLSERELKELRAQAWVDEAREKDERITRQRREKPAP